MELDPYYVRKLEGSFKGVQKPIFFDKLLRIVHVMSKLEHSAIDKNKFPLNYTKERAGKVGMAAVELCFLGCSDKAFKLVNTTPSLMLQDGSWHYLGSYNVKFVNFRIQILQNCCLGHFDKVVEVAKSIMLEDSKFITFDESIDQDIAPQLICEELVKSNQWDKAKEILDCVRCEKKKERIFNIMTHTRVFEPLTRTQIIAFQQNLQTACTAVRITGLRFV